MQEEEGYIEIIFPGIDENHKEILIAWLNEAGYDGFEEQQENLIAFISQREFDKKVLDDLLKQMAIPYRLNAIKPENWNQLWESSFHPVLINNTVFIRADFHKPATEAKYDIIITPKMSFGTGHHDTTAMMIEAMCDLDFEHKVVLDFGTGTGILAILAEKLGAETVLAIDRDSWSTTNAKENIANNNCSRVVLRQNDILPGGKQFDLILSNINKNVILDFGKDFATALKKGGVLLVSGLLESDLDEIIIVFARQFGAPILIKKKNNWACLAFINE